MIERLTADAIEVAANTFIVLCGPREHGETRLMICQAIQAIGSVLSGILANKVFFTNVGDDGYSSSTVLINVQWTYLAITLLCAALGLFFFYMPLPEVSDQELEDSTKRIPVDPKKKTVVGLQLRTVAIILAVLAQWFYVGAQECNSTYFRALLLSTIPPNTSSGVTTETTNPVASDRPPGIAVSIPDYLLIGHGAFAVSRILFSYLLYLSGTRPSFPKPRKLLSISLVFSFIFALLPVVLKLSNPNLLVIPVILFFFFEGPAWPLIFAIGLRGQGRRTKRAAAFLTMSNSGGGIAPFIMYGIVASGGSVRISYILIVVLQALIMAYMLLLECVKDVRTMVDPIPKAPNSIADEEAPSHDVTSNDLHQGEALNGNQKTLFGNFKGFRLPVPRRKSSSFVGGFLHNEDRVTK
jgi:fucose permease